MKSQRVLNLESLTLAYDGKKAGVLARLGGGMWRTRVPGGWLVVSGGTNGVSGVTFYPDPDHRWDGGSLD